MKTQEQALVELNKAILEMNESYMNSEPMKFFTEEDSISSKKKEKRVVKKTKSKRTKQTFEYGTNKYGIFWSNTHNRWKLQFRVYDYSSNYFITTQFDFKGYDDESKMPKRGSFSGIAHRIIDAAANPLNKEDIRLAAIAVHYGWVCSNYANNGTSKIVSNKTLEELL